MNISMKIAIDSGSLADGHAARGVGSYTRHLVSALQNLIADKKNISIELLDIDPKQTDFHGANIVHYPFFDFFFHTLRIRKGMKTVVTIHDTIPLIYPRYYPAGIKGKIKLMLQKKALRNVSHIITNSETSKKDIVRFLGVENKKVTPIYLGPTVPLRSLSKNEIESVKKRYSLPDQYILYVGDVNWNKNLLMLCAVAKKAHITLVIVGKAAVQENISNHIENQPIHELLAKYKSDPSIIRLGYIEDLLPIFKGATFLCQPSLYEGFGFSVLDAMNIGTPTLISKIQAFSELYSGAALFFDPHNENDLVEKILKMKNDKKMRELFAKKGKDRAKDFSWKKTAEMTLDIYSNVLEN